MPTLALRARVLTLLTLALRPSAPRDDEVPRRLAGCLIAPVALFRGKDRREQ
jgi:hypothetical protein